MECPKCDCIIDLEKMKLVEELKNEENPQIKMSLQIELKKYDELQSFFRRQQNRRIP